MSCLLNLIILQRYNIFVLLYATLSSIHKIMYSALSPWDRDLWLTGGGRVWGPGPGHAIVGENCQEEPGARTCQPDQGDQISRGMKATLARRKAEKRKRRGEG